MKAPIRLSIPTPCHENWETFSPAATGRFCQSCGKNIVDFTKLDDDEIVAYLASHSGPVCGRLHPNQLKTYRELERPKISPGLALLQAGLIWLILALVSRVTFASQVPTPVETEISINNVNQPTQSQSTLDQRVRGVVTSAEDDMPLPGVNVNVKGSNKRTVTDVEGRFEIWNLEPGDVLIFSFIGFQTAEYEVGNHEDIIHLKMSLNISFLGEVLIEPVTPATTTPGFWSRLFRRD